MANCPLRMDVEQAMGLHLCGKKEVAGGWAERLPFQALQPARVVEFLYSAVLITGSPNGFEPPEKPKNPGVDGLSLLQGDRPNPEIELGSPALQADSLLAELSGKPQWF